MALTIGETAMTSDQSAHTARQVPGPSRGWEVSWLPGQLFDRNTAITAMSLADIAATGTSVRVTGSGLSLRVGPPKSAWPDPTPSAARPSRCPASAASRNQPSTSQIWRRANDQPR